MITALDNPSAFRGTRLAVELVDSKQFKAMNAKIHWPKFNQCKNFEPTPNELSALLTNRYLKYVHLKVRI